MIQETLSIGQQRARSGHMKNVLFVCSENSYRSQVAEAFTKIHGKHFINAFSAGIKPSGKISPKAAEAMGILGYDLMRHKSKSVNDFAEMRLFLPAGRFDCVVIIGSRRDYPYIPARHIEEWNIPDPQNVPMKEHIVVRNLIESKVKALIARISAEL